VDRAGLERWSYYGVRFMAPNSPSIALAAKRLDFLIPFADEDGPVRFITVWSRVELRARKFWPAPN